MKPLKPSAKENKRYLLVKGENLKQNIEKIILEFIGIIGMSKCGLSLIKSDSKSALICINREMVDFVRAAFCVWPNKIEIIKISGTIKKIGDKLS
jgi:RNase P/RNase MRP subunit POP5